MTWRLAASLIKLREQVNEAVPSRDKSSDGSIGDENHASRSSDHNPWVNGGVVTAIDITHDPRNGFDSYAFADWLLKTQDERIKYVISNGRIFSSQVDAWKWRKYSGTNKHDHHVHISVLSEKGLYDDTSLWQMPGESFKPDKKAKPVSDDPVLAKGTKGAGIVELQKLLKIESDGDFGPKTDEAVRLFQKGNGLVPDGVVGHYTWEKLRKGK